MTKVLQFVARRNHVLNFARHKSVLSDVKVYTLLRKPCEDVKVTRMLSKSRKGNVSPDSNVIQQALQPQVEKHEKSAKQETNFWKKWKHSRLHAVHGNHELVMELKELFESIKSSALLNETDRSDLHLQSWHKDPSEILQSLETKPSQVGGFTLSKFKERSEGFIRCGVPLYDSICLAFAIPSCVRLSSENIGTLYACLNSYGCSFGEIVSRYPYVLSLDTKIIASNLECLVHVGASQGQELHNILLKYPALFYFHLDQAVVNLAKAARSKLGVHQASIESFMAPFHGIAVQTEAVPEHVVDGSSSKTVADAKSFLISLGISPLSVFQKCPEFFAVKEELLNVAVDALVGNPFFLEAEDLTSLIQKHPETFVQFTQPETKKLVKLIQKVCSTSVRLYNLITQIPGIFHNPVYFSDRVALFKSYGFTNKHIDEILSKKGSAVCFVDCADSKEVPFLLELYFKSKDITPSQVTSSAPVSLSKDSLKEVSKRLEFLREVKPHGVKDISLRHIIKMEVAAFVEDVCGSSIEVYNEFVSNKFRV